VMTIGPRPSGEVRAGNLFGYETYRSGSEKLKVDVNRA